MDLTINGPFTEDELSGVLRALRDVGIESVTVNAGAPAERTVPRRLSKVCHRLEMLRDTALHVGRDDLIAGLVREDGLTLATATVYVSQASTQGLMWLDEVGLVLTDQGRKMLSG